MKLSEICSAIVKDSCAEAARINAFNAWWRSYMMPRIDPLPYDPDELEPLRIVCRAAFVAGCREVFDGNSQPHGNDH